ncbi:DUF1516 family protein [Sporolactobacillus shoreicorticis]|uniref:DUF1516 family protein n=1 Tax=Sporolactobacillus shoreicorticis TaxID=1923877 RepID=A0ABW5S889_9BACL|nr:DUF1516 family protein [Sporolactobacillus shoreicorticis]MCO7125544.1 DUF1516 family protein [Sporolactobacillus shoreicorticis]
MHTLLQIHGLVWGLVVIFFILSYVLPDQKIWSMILRTAYLVMIITGVVMLVLIHFPLMPTIKGVLSFALIGLMEVAIGKRKKKEISWFIPVLIAALLLVIVFMGYHVI